MVLIGAGRTFIAGADIKHLGKPRPAGKRNQELIEENDKPVVAAIHGYALGGGHARKFPIADRLVETGRYGQKTGARWYRYEPGDRTPHTDPVAVAGAPRSFSRSWWIRADPSPTSEGTLTLGCRP